MSAGRLHLTRLSHTWAPPLANRISRPCASRVCRAVRACRALGGARMCVLASLVNIQSSVHRRHCLQDRSWSRLSSSPIVEGLFALSDARSMRSAPPAESGALTRHAAAAPYRTEGRVTSGAHRMPPRCAWLRWHRARTAKSGWAATITRSPRRSSCRRCTTARNTARSRHDMPSSAMTGIAPRARERGADPPLRAVQPTTRTSCCAPDIPAGQCSATACLEG